MTTKTKSNQTTVVSQGSNDDPTDSPIEPTVAPEVPYVGDGQEDDSEARKAEFVKGYQELSQRTQYAITCLIASTGPMGNLVDLKKDGKS